MKNTYKVVYVNKSTLDKTTITLNDSPNSDADGCSPYSLNAWFEHYRSLNETNLAKEYLKTFVSDFTNETIPKNSFIFDIIVE